jgi:hypothetical protein
MDAGANAPLRHTTRVGPKSFGARLRPETGADFASPKAPKRLAGAGQLTTVTARRFCDQAASLWPSATGRSLPYEMVLMRSADTPWLIR